MFQINYKECKSKENKDVTAKANEFQINYKECKSIILNIRLLDHVEFQINYKECKSEEEKVINYINWSFRLTIRNVNVRARINIISVI